jgi:ferric-dicitrate binding protein FerR (iron transport regulator)/cell division protein ZapA (FtsZ GTPase activity inhibitor)
MKKQARQKTDPTWERFAAQLKLVRQPLSVPPSPNEVARLLQRAEEADSRAPVWSRFLVPSGVFALVVAGVIGFLSLRGEPEVTWTAKTVVADGSTTTGSLTETRPDGRALLSLGDDTVGVGPGSRVEIAAASSRATRLVLMKGSVAAHVDPSRGRRNFEVETPLGRVHVVGTIFRVRAMNEELLVEVQKGTVEVTHGSATSKVTVGQRLVVKAGVATLGTRESDAAFDELSLAPVVVAVAPVPVAEPQPEPVVEVPVELEPEPESAKKKGSVSVLPSKLREWRTRAARGECGLVMVEVKRFLGQVPDDVTARMTLADCQRRSGDKAGALESYLKASSGKSADANRATLMAAAVLQDELSQPAKAIKQLDKYLARGAESRDLEASVLVRKARALKQLRKKSQARGVVEVVLKKFSDTPAAAEALRLRDSL